ncbi:class I SAM-dependent methyltransferase [Crossiella sp. CA-258035]|uniref:class I SAM-dependent methyltransferase n=1 Tax=Crossiella sp. CA-258035 TaxID=2981138 RepID=UPI0024BC88BA|nr:class I SAM-dependent methyltransferase [Crossiella sp. CA-258035]WHT17027.1 class I SAM-dependent methyltransferase [Crossiella sp. CA-258035]
MSPRRRWIRRLVHAAVLGLLAADTAQLRRRLAALPVLREQLGPAHEGAVAVAEGVTLTAATMAAAQAHRHREQLASLDLVPADLPTAQALDLLREVDPATCRLDRLTAGRTAAHAIAADADLLAEVGLSARPSAPELATAALELKLHAPADTACAVAPGLAAAPAVRAQDAAVQQAAHGPGLALHLLLRAAVLTALAATALTGRKWAAGLLAAWSAQPLLVFAGSRGLRPADLPRACLTRVVAEPARLVRTLVATAPARAERTAAIATSRIAYRADLAAGTGRFFHRPRRDCPWCGSAQLRRRLVATDLHTHKPGRFVLDECRGCGHVFQNPRLTEAGLEFYYRDAYDGLNEHAVQSVFATRREYFLSQARSLLRHGKPERWLDVGTGHGHFCNQAKEIWPQTSFDGLDLSSGVELARRRGILEHAYRGLFPDLAPTLAGRYDAVSMFHYLEHATDPVGELRAAHLALRPGGHLVIEVPDPDCRFSRLLGRFWGGWLQPQHLHMYPMRNLRAKLTELGFTVVGAQRREAGAPDLTVAAWLLANHLAPRADQPWQDRAPGAAQRVLRGAALTAATPVLLAAAAADRLLEPAAEGLRICNAYRLIARRD